MSLLVFSSHRTNGRPYVTVLRPSVCHLSVCDVCIARGYWLNGAS